MHHILVSDIFGRTDALETIASHISGSVDIIDPYKSENMNFQTEAEAYEYFIAEVGLDRYTQLLLSNLTRLEHLTRLIGFSVGGSAIWNCSEDKELGQVVDATCFYSAQIRHAPQIIPGFPIKLILPATEAHFSVADLKASLSNKANLLIEQTDYLHGFMNRYSINYDREGYESFISLLS